MLLEEDFKAWLTARGITAQISYDALPDESPHRAIAISVSGGLGLTVEQAFDRPNVSVLTRGVNGRDARDLAAAVDAAILDAETGFWLGTGETAAWVADKGRFGGPPSYVATDDRNRVVRSATYFFEVSR
jgi:hypothetical protein